MGFNSGFKGLTKFAISRLMFVQAKQHKIWRKFLQWEGHWFVRTDGQKDKQNDAY